MANVIKIGNRSIGAGAPVYIVAELSANHNQSFDQAVRIIHAAKDAGADAACPACEGGWSGLLGEGWLSCGGRCWRGGGVGEGVIASVGPAEEHDGEGGSEDAFVPARHAD